MGIRSKRSYHHGDLRRVLLEAAWQLIEERGASQISLRAIARFAGVSHAAPYHHFADLEDLLAAVAATAFIRLREEMSGRSARAPVGGSLARLQEAGIAYVGFAARNPELYRLMFGGRLRHSRDHPGLAEAADQAYAVLGALLAEVEQVKGRDQPSRGPSETARAVWSLVHGLAMLLIDGRFDIDAGDSAQVEALTRQVTGVLGRGLRHPA